MTTDGGKTWTKTLYVDEYTSATEHRHRPEQPAEPLGRDVPAPAHGVGVQRRRQGKRPVSEHRRRPNVEEGDRRRPAARHDGSHRARHLQNAAERHLRADRSRAGQGAALDRRGAGTRRLLAAAAGRGGGGGGGGRGGPAAPPNPQTSGVWRSNDKGRTWTFMSNENQRPMYFSQIRVDPNNPDVVYLGGVGPTKSVDGGKTWQGLNNMGHVDNHAIWIDPLNSKHVMYGNDGGVDVTYDAGAKWEAVRMWAERPRVSRVGGHAPSVLRLHRSPGQRLVVRAELRARRTAASANGCGFERRRRRRFPEPDRSDGLQHLLYGISERRNAAVRPHNRRGAEHQADPRRRERRWWRRWWRWRWRRRAGWRSAGGPPGPTGGRGNIINPIPGATVQFNWNSPIGCRHTIPARSASAVARSSSRATAAIPGR